MAVHVLKCTKFKFSTCRYVLNLVEDLNQGSKKGYAGDINQFAARPAGRQISGTYNFVFICSIYTVLFKILKNLVDRYESRTSAPACHSALDGLTGRSSA